MSKVGDSKRVKSDGEGVSKQQTETEANDNSDTELLLHNPLVLNVIFDHLSKKDWKPARLVNKTWHSILQKRWRNQMNYKLGVRVPEPVVKTFTIKHLAQQHPSGNRNDPMQLYDHPIRNISIRWDAEYNNFELQRDQVRFWWMFGPNLKSIQLYNIHIPKIAYLKRLLFELTPCLEELSFIGCYYRSKNKLRLNENREYSPPASLQTNLKLLILDTSFDSHSHKTRWQAMDYQPQFPISWIKFFSVFPNIQKLKLKLGIYNNTLHDDGPSDPLKLFEAIDIIRKANNNQVLNITELSVFGEDVLDQVDLMRNQSMFASLPIAILGVDVTLMGKVQIYVLVQTLKSTLVELELSSWTGNGRLPKNMFPQGLTKLYLRSSIISSLEFLTYTPNLEELELQEIYGILPPEVDVAAITPLVHLKKLAYAMRSDLVPSEEMDNLAKLMPNVKDCEGYVDADAFQAMCRGWPNLEHLDLPGRFHFCDEDIFVESLVQLKCLRSVRVNGYISITDKSVFGAFLKMPSLTRIDLHLDSVMITEAGLKALECKLPWDFVQNLRKLHLQRVL